jgi:hypothetical protein
LSAWSASSISSSVEEETRLEKLLAVAALVTDVGVDALQIRTRGGC